jgi:hypothetical protein
MGSHILRAGILQIMVLVMTVCRLVCGYTFTKKMLPSSSRSHYISNFTLHVGPYDRVFFLSPFCGSDLPSFFRLTSAIKPHFHPNDFSVTLRPHPSIQRIQASHFFKMLLVNSYRSTQCQTPEGRSLLALAH